MSRIIKISLIEPSIIIREGLIHIFELFKSPEVELSTILEYKKIVDRLNVFQPEIVILNPIIADNNTLSQIKSTFSGIKTVALATTYIHNAIINEYDEVITINDSVENIQKKLVKIANIEEDDDKKELSDREKEIIVYIVKGMTNKEIADELCLSPHTIITHRRNIVSKLNIHSVSGLTIYAIVNKMVSLEDIHQES